MRDFAAERPHAGDEKGLVLRRCDQYGAAKTTLIKEIVGGNIVGTPKHLMCVHVVDSELGEMSKSCLSAVEYLRQMALNISVNHTSRGTLLSASVREAVDLHRGTPMAVRLRVKVRGCLSFAKSIGTPYQSGRWWY